ncbi:DNA-protecting protein DprA [Candidatus Amesbacteria bacterium]|nr:DNA-protecting protein DprA [Candidatus Amesbacteria bacterium]
MEKAKRLGKFKVYWKGEWDGKLFEKCAAVVGSRRMTQYGQRVVEKLVPVLVHEGWTIVSGFMYGVDQAAHKTCLDCGGRTIAVVGWGINWQGISEEDSKLESRITNNGGLIISEWKEQQPAYWTFPARNKIVAGLSERIYVVEAAAKSGALITAEMGRQLGREIWAVPGPITSSVSVGVNRLIGSGQAKMWLPGESVRVEEYKSVSNRKNAEIYALLQNEVLTVDDLVRATGRRAEEIGSELTMMMLSGDIVEKDGKYYVSES